MAIKFVSRQNVFVILGAVMIVCLALTIVTFPVALIWIGQPLGNAAGLTAEALVSAFSVAFFAAFALAMAGQKARSIDSSRKKPRLRLPGHLATQMPRGRQLNTRQKNKREPGYGLTRLSEVTLRARPKRRLERGA
jgi:hypothetical protein